MSKTFKKAISIFVTAMFILSLLPGSVLAEDAAAASYAFENPSITFNTETGKVQGKVTLHNTSLERQEFKVYLAVYSGGELIGLNVSSTDLIAEASQSEVEFSTSEIDFDEGNEVKLFVWNKDGITPELVDVDTYTEVSPSTDPKNADLKSITLPLAQRASKQYQKPVMYPAFDKDTTEYTIVVKKGSNTSNSYSRQTLPVLETVNPEATTSRSPSGSPSANANLTLTYTVTSADETVTKDYKINYVMADDLSYLAIGAARNGYLPGGDVCCYSYQKGTSEVDIADANAPIVVQDGYYNSKHGDIKPTVSILEIDISLGADRIEHGILALYKYQDKLTSSDGTMRLYEIDDSINSAGDITEIPQSDVYKYLGDEICSLIVHPKKGTDFDIYYINIGPDYYNSLKAAGKTKMYIGLSGEAANSSESFCSVFYNGTASTPSRFHYIPVTE